MKLKNIFLLNVQFIQLLNKLIAGELPVRILFPLSECFDSFGKNEKKIHEMKDKLINKNKILYNENNEKDISPEEKAENIKKYTESFNKEMNDLLNYEFQLPIQDKIEFDVKSVDLEKFKMTLDEMNLLKAIFKFKDSNIIEIKEETKLLKAENIEGG